VKRTMCAAGPVGPAVNLDTDNYTTTVRSQELYTNIISKLE